MSGPRTAAPSLAVQILLVAGGLSACFEGADTDSGDAVHPCESGVPALELGEGEELFEALAPGDPVVMVHGPQEGWHITGAIRAWNTEDIVRLTYTVTVPAYDDATIVDQTYRFKLVPEGDCGGTQPALTGYIELDELTDDEKTEPHELLAYETVVMRMHLTDEAGVDLVETLELQAVPDPQDLEMDPEGSPRRPSSLP